MICQRDIVGPNIILPFLKSNHATQYITRMHTNAHVDVNPSGITHFPIEHKNLLSLMRSKNVACIIYLVIRGKMPLSELNGADMYLKYNLVPLRCFFLF